MKWTIFFILVYIMYFVVFSVRGCALEKIKIPVCETICDKKGRELVSPDDGKALVKCGCGERKLLKDMTQP